MVYIPSEGITGQTNHVVVKEPEDSQAADKEEASFSFPDFTLFFGDGLLDGIEWVEFDYYAGICLSWEA